MQLPTPDVDRKRTHLHHDGFQVQYLIETGLKGVVGFNFVVKRSYEIVPDRVAQPVTLQRVLNTVDIYYEHEINPLITPVKYETDLMPPKPACDVIVHGHCYAPGGEATTAECGIKIGKKFSKNILVIGDRSAWQPAHQSRALITAARPFAVMPLRWENAYGGIDESTPGLPMIHATNPSGRGFWAKTGEGQPTPERYGPLPNLENPKAPLQLDRLVVDPVEWRDGPQPINFGIVPKHRLPRAELAGMNPTIRPLWDLLYKKVPQGAESLKQMREMQRSFYNAAPPDQQIEYPNGGETVILTNLHPTHQQLRFKLPVDHPRLRWDCGKGFAPVKLNIDTILIEPDLMYVDVCWRGFVPAPEGYDIEDIGLARMEVDGALTLPAQLLDTGFPLSLLTEAEP